MVTAYLPKGLMVKSIYNGFKNEGEFKRWCEKNRHFTDANIEPTATGYKEQ
jgi:hypothetical protein